MPSIVRLLLATVLLMPTSLFAEDAQKIIKEAVDYWRGSTSYAEARMVIHRPDWERSMAFRSWTKGEELSLVRFTAPAKDAGNASLTRTDEMWTFTPKIQRVVKIPPSMMSQSWMGSDFSHSDLAKQNDIVEKYSHALVGSETHEGKKVYVIESKPKEEAAVVWGKEVLKVREDHIIVERSFFDQDGALVKQLRAHEIVPSDGKLYAKTIRMTNKESSDEWTEVVHEKMRFGLELSDAIFTLSNLSNPRFEQQ